MEDRVVDYFVVAGLPEDNLQIVDEDVCEGLNPNQQNIEPITDITVIFPSLGEYVPKGFECVEHTPSGFPANLNSGSLRSPEVYLCYRRGRDKPPLVDIGVMYDGKERLLPDAEVVLFTPEGRPANVNNTSARTLLTFRRAPDNMPCNELVVTDICVIFQNKGEKSPHAFCQINKNLNKGMMGCDVFLCYKKSMNRPPLLSFKPEVLLRYPPVDRRSFPFPPLTATFCLPMCATVECWPQKSVQPRAVFSTFVLTVADATEKVYGAAITFYEEFDGEDRLTDEQKQILSFVSADDKAVKRLHVNKSICVLSHHPFFDAFRTFLYYLNWMVRNGPHEVPIERYISHLLEEVPYPSSQRPHILMQVSPTQNILFSHPHDTPFPKSGACFRAMLSNLGTENCLMVMLLVLTEQKLLVHSLRPDILTAVAEAISVLIFPFRWQCPYIPLCPLGLCGVLQAPVPFLVGVDSRFFDLYEPPTDITCIDLDTNTITVSEDRRYLLMTKLLPKKASRALKNTLELIKSVSDRMLMTSRAATKGRSDLTETMDIDFQQKRRERAIEMEIQEAFLRFMTSILRGYRQYLLPITKAPTIGATDASSLFDFQGFLRSRDKNFQKFYQLMLRTQMFIRFIEERSFVCENDSNLEFFDECVDKVEAVDEAEVVKLWESNEGNQSDRTVFVMPPEPSGLPVDATYSYNNKFDVKEGLFWTPELRSQGIDRVLQMTEQSSPGSPVARRTKQEIKSAQKVAKKFSEKPVLWAKYLLSTCYSIWFIHLPSYVSVASSKQMALCMAYDILARMANCGLQPADEVCYRVVMQLCGLYNQPVIAVKVLLTMKRCGITPNALTYGYYNKAVLEAEWPSNVTTSSQLMWNKLRNVILGVAHFRAAGKHRHAGDTVDVDRVSTESGVSSDSRNSNRFPISKSGAQHSKGQSDFEAPILETPHIPTRISSSSDIGYGSMHEQKLSSDDIAGSQAESPSERQAKMAKFLGKMGQSLDQWVKSGVSSLASLAAETSYYSQSGLLMGAGLGGFGYAGDFGTSMRPEQYEDEDDDEVDDQVPSGRAGKGKSRRRLEFGDDEQQSNDTETEKSESQTSKLLRSISFGNDTQFMSKLKLVRDDPVSKAAKSPQCNTNTATSGDADEDHERRSTSVETSSSSVNLEAKVNQYYDGSAESRNTSVEKSVKSSREGTPNESHETYQDTIRPGGLEPHSSPTIEIRSEQKSGEVTPSSPARKAVTQDDPLGALSEPSSPEKKATDKINANHVQQQNRGSPKRTSSEGHIDGLNEKTVMGPPPDPVKGFHRSSTLPNYASSMNPSTSAEKLVASEGNSGPSGLTMFSSNLRSPFGRYSPGRLSLRKAGTSFIESTIGGKKAEALMEGFNQFKSAATVTVKSKLEELKEAVGNNATPGKTGPFGRYDDEIDSEPEPPSEQWAAVSESYLEQLLTTEPGSTRPSFASVDYGGVNGVHESPISGSRNSLLLGEQFKTEMLGVALSTTAAKSTVPKPVAVEINITTCSLCHNCSSLLFDEEIMSGWTSEDSNLNTRCPHCKQWEVPFLEVTVVDYRQNPMSQISLPVTYAPSLESVNSISRRTSVANPANLPQPDESQTEATDIKQGETVTDGQCTSKPVDEASQPAELDPLGVLEESRKSRKASPETENSQVPCQSANAEVSVSNPVISVSASENNAFTATETNLPEFVVPVDLQGASSDPIIVPYLSPLVLRKELENVLDHEGDSCLVQARFVDDHPIIYWNMVWFFHRGNLPSHMKGLTLQARSVRPTKLIKKQTDKGASGECDEAGETFNFSIDPSWETVDHRNVKVSCFWDNPKFHEQFTTPLYLEWFKIRERERNKEQVEDDPSDEDNANMAKLVSGVLKAAQGNALAQTCSQLLFHYHKQPQARHYPTYRDILFLCLISGKDSLEAYGYGLDREYRDVYSKLRNNDDYESMDVGDTPVSDTALFCRRYFKELLLPTPKM